MSKENYVPDVCIYHDKCNDGFAAAWAIHQRWPDVEFHAMNYGQELPDIDFRDRNVLAVDFSFSEQVTMDLARKCQTVVILDHHKTARENLASFRKEPSLDYRSVYAIVKNDSIETPASNVIACFDMEKSGARLAWEFAWPATEAPHLIDFVEDRDLWRFDLKHTRRVHLMLTTVPYDFAAWTETMHEFEGNTQSFLERADAIERYHDARVADIVETATWRRIGRYEVPLAWCPYAYASDVCHQLLHMYPDAPFAAACIMSYGQTSYSLRSRNDLVDVSEVAKLYGGGGHHNAAGFRIP